MSDYDFPPDEFDQPPAAGQSVGIHRAPQSTWSKLWPYLVVVIIFAALAYGVVTWFASQSPKSPAATPPPPSVTQSAEPTEATPEETTDTSEEPTSEEPTSEEPTSEERTPEETSPEPEETTPEPEPSEEATTAELDRAVAVRVLNATSRGGLAGIGVNKLGAAGWTNATAANYTGSAVSVSSVWFKAEENRAEAEEIASDLGISDVALQPSLVGPISVILATAL